jgi:hypothetical protein
MGWAALREGIQIPTRPPHPNCFSYALSEDDRQTFVSPVIFSRVLMIFIPIPHILPRFYSESVYYFIDDLSFSPAFDFAPCPLASPSASLSFQSSFVSTVEHISEGGRGRGQIIRRRESLVLYNPLTTLCP